METVASKLPACQELVVDEKQFEFAGKHLLVSYIGCPEEKFLDNAQLMQCLRDAIAACGATILGEQFHVFPNGALTASMMLSESHSSLHTYPEHASCFAEIFTCGENCDLSRFDALLTNYLQPTKTSKLLINRGNKTDIAIA